MTVRWPKSHMEIYERRAAEHGLSISEYLVMVTAGAHDLELQDGRKDNGQQLSLSA
ncbi:MAG: hypothetical protein ACRD0H_07715 [Actinomycetes bacterium]